MRIPLVVLSLSLAFGAAFGTSACDRRDDKVATTGTLSAGVDPNDVAAAQRVARGRLADLEARVTYGETWGTDVPMRRIADHILETVVEMGFVRSEVGVAVQEVASPSRPRIVVVVKMKYLQDDARQDRNALARLVHDAAAKQAPGVMVYVGLRSASAYGAIAVADTGPELDVVVGREVAPVTLERALLP